MDLYNWLVSGGEQTDTAAEVLTPSSSSFREPPDFLKVHRTAPPKPKPQPQPAPTAEGGHTTTTTTEAYPLTPLESQLRDIILSVYSDRHRQQKPAPQLKVSDYSSTTTASRTVLGSCDTTTGASTKSCLSTTPPPLSLLSL